MRPGGPPSHDPSRPASHPHSQSSGPVTCECALACGPSVDPPRRRRLLLGRARELERQVVLSDVGLHVVPGEGLCGTESQRRGWQRQGGWSSRARAGVWHFIHSTRAISSICSCSSAETESRCRTSSCRAAGNSPAAMLAAKTSRTRRPAMSCPSMLSSLSPTRTPLAAAGCTDGACEGPRGAESEPSAAQRLFFVWRRCAPILARRPR